MECQACHTANPDSNRFCENCGGALKYRCAQCGFSCGAGARFCGGCGAPASPAAADQAAVAPAPAVATPEASGWGELKQATVLFADIVSSTEQIASLDPEQAMDRLRPAVMTMCSAVERFGGTVIRTLGDGVMALFGVPKALEGHATLACEAALHMQSLFSGNPQGFSIRVGLHSGQVASDPYAADRTKGGGAHGLTIHLASRVIAIAPPGQITLTSDCYAQVRAGGQVRSLGFPPLKGIPNPVEIFLLTGLNRETGNHQFQQARLTPLRGRGREMAALEALRVRAADGGGNVVGLTGAPGSGKSRLCFEFAQRCRGDGVPVFEVHAQLYGHATPLQPALELLRVYFFQLPREIDPAVARRIVGSRLADAGLPDESDAALVQDFLGLGSDAAHAAPLNPQARRGRLLDIVRSLVRHMAATHALLVIEDLHWLDEASEEFISVMVDALAGTRMLLLLNYRPTYRCPWARARHFEQVELGELPAGDMDALVAELVAPLTVLPDICRLVCRRAGGNPFFAEELVRTLAESHLLRASGGLPAGGLDALEQTLPATVQAVVGARLDRLGEPEKTLLQMCAIIGKDIPLAVLEHVASPLAQQIQKGLDGLCEAGLILPQPSGGGRRFAFRHPLIQEVAYNTQLKVRRSQVHSSVALAMEVYYREQLDENAGLIAYHYEAAGRSLEAALYASRAAKWVGSTNPALAIRHWHKTRALLKGQQRSAEVDRLRALAGGRIVYLGWREGLSLEEVNELIAEAQDLASAADERLPQLLLFAQGRMLQASGGPAEAYVEMLQRALAMQMPPDDPGRLATLNLALSQACLWCGQLAQGLAANDIAMQGLPDIGAFDREFIGFSVEHWALSIRIRLLARMGRFDEARACLERMRPEQDSWSDPVIGQIAHYVNVDMAWAMQDASMLGPHAAEVARIAQKHPTSYSRVIAMICQGLAEQTACEWANAKQTFLATLALLRETRAAVDFEAEALASLCECHLRLDELPQALHAAKDAIALAKQRNNRIAECRALIVAGSVLVRSPQLDDSEKAAHTMFSDARQLIDLTGARILEQAYRNALSGSGQPASL